MAPLEERDVPSFPFSMDVSEPYVETPRSNVYIVSFVEWLTNWLEAFDVGVELWPIWWQINFTQVQGPCAVSYGQ